MEIDSLKDLLSYETATPIGILIVACLSLVYYVYRQDSKYARLQKEFNVERESTKKLLIEMVSKSVAAMEQNTKAIESMKELYMYKK